MLKYLPPKNTEAILDLWPFFSLGSFKPFQNTRVLIGLPYVRRGLNHGETDLFWGTATATGEGTEGLEEISTMFPHDCWWDAFPLRMGSPKNTFICYCGWEHPNLYVMDPITSPEIVACGSYCLPVEIIATGNSHVIHDYFGLKQHVSTCLKLHRRSETGQPSPTGLPISLDRVLEFPSEGRWKMRGKCMTCCCYQFASHEMEFQMGKLCLITPTFQHRKLLPYLQLLWRARPQQNPKPWK